MNDNLNSLGQIDSSAILVEKEVLRDYYTVQRSLLELELGNLVESGEYITRWALLPKPPFSVVFTDDLVPKKIVVMNEPSRGVYWFLYFMSLDVVSQALTSNCVKCPIKQESIECPRKDEDCGQVTDLEHFRVKRFCTFEILIESISKREGHRLSVEDAQFIDDLRRA